MGRRSEYRQRTVSSDDTLHRAPGQEPSDTEEPATDAIGSGLVAEKAKRLAKLDEMRASGTNPYPYRFDRSSTLAELRAQHGSLEAGTETEVEVDRKSTRLNSSHRIASRMPSSA